jgi:N4-bis(aminopropyl)spermidine synthase
MEKRALDPGVTLACDPIAHNGTATSLRAGAILTPDKNPAPPLLKDKLLIKVTQADLEAVRIIEEIRPKSLRAYDQIPMKSEDMVRQTKLVGPLLRGKSVVFMGDHDSTSLLLALLGELQNFPKPAHMLILDFDERLLVAANALADRYGFNDILDVQLYNAFDPVPLELMGKFDWFYTNPPYGCRNQGESARLFITRCFELVRSDEANGCIILPHDPSRPWTRSAMLATQRFLCNYDWTALGP